MKMILGSGSPLDYGLYISNCQTRQRKYTIPVTSLLDVQLYIAFGADNPGDTVAINLVHTCGALAGTTEPLTPAAYVIGQDPDLNYYGVFQGFNETTDATGFVITIEFGDSIYFSEEYAIDPCKVLTLVKSCYGNLEPEISFDAEDIYFGQSQGGTLGDASVIYEHKFYMREVEVSVNAIKNDFKQGKTRNFRTESINLFLFWGEFIPGWYLPHVDTIFKRGEIFIGEGDAEKKWLLDNTIYENLDDCTQCWRPAVLLKKGHDNSFSCEEDPCTVVVPGDEGGGEDTCCNPTVINATVEFAEGNTVTLNFTPCEPTPANGYFVLYRVAGSGGSFLSVDTISSPLVIGVGGSDGDQYEGFIYSDCGGGILGDQIPWATVVAEPSAYSFNLVSPCISNGYTPLILEGGVEGDIAIVRFTFSGNMAKAGGSFVRADLKVRSPYVDDPPTFSPIPEFNASSQCYVDTIGHGIQNDTNTGPLFIEITMIMPAGGSATLDSFAVVNNSNPVIPKGLLVELVSVNAVPVTDVSILGCTGNQITAGTC